MPDRSDTPVEQADSTSVVTVADVRPEEPLWHEIEHRLDADVLGKISRGHEIMLVIVHPSGCHCRLD